MNRKLEQPKVTIYSTVEIVEDILREHVYDGDISSEELAKSILTKLNIPFGEEKEISIFENHIRAELIDGKVVTFLVR